MTELKIFSDGGARGNPGPAAIGFVVLSADGKTIFEHGEAIGKATNNVAEYQGVILALRWLTGFLTVDSNIQKANFFLDSKLVVNQAEGKFKIKKPHLQQLFSQLKALEKSLDIEVSYHYVPREKNQRADELLNQVLDNKLL